MRLRPFLAVIAIVVSLDLACSRTPPETERRAAPTPPPGAPGPSGSPAAANAPPAPAAAMPPPASAAPATTTPATAAPATAAPTTAAPAAPAAPASSAAPPPPPAQATPAARPHSDHPAAVEMGGRVEYWNSRDVGDYARIKLLDSNPGTYWMPGNSYPAEVTVSFLNRDTALVSGVTLTLPPHAILPVYDKPNDPAFAKDVEIWTSKESAKTGFQKVATGTLPQATGDHDIGFATPVEARYVKVVIASNYGSPISPLIADLAVREGHAPGYVPLL